MAKRILRVLAGVALLWFAAKRTQADGNPQLAGFDVAVIVNKGSSVVSLSSRDLRGILLGTKDAWPDGTKLIAVSLPTERPETRMILKEVCGMSEADFKRYFLMMNFQGKSVSPPRMMRTSTSIKAFVESTRGALGVIPLRDVDPSVTVMSIDGVRPGTPGYKLSMTQ